MYAGLSLGQEPSLLSSVGTYYMFVSNFFFFFLFSHLVLIIFNQDNVFNHFFSDGSASLPRIKSLGLWNPSSEKLKKLAISVTYLKKRCLGLANVSWEKDVFKISREFNTDRPDSIGAYKNIYNFTWFSQYNFLWWAFGHSIISWK